MAQDQVLGERRRTEAKEGMKQDLLVAENQVEAWHKTKYMESDEEQRRRKVCSLGPSGKPRPDSGCTTRGSVAEGRQTGRRSGMA